jgi:hypothetical protein
MHELEAAQRVGLEAGGVREKQLRSKLADCDLQLLQLQDKLNAKQKVRAVFL